MSTNLSKIIAFLKNNQSMQFECADIAYHIKLDETYVEQAMKFLHKEGFVIQSKDVSGKMVWAAAKKSPDYTESGEWEKKSEKIEINQYQRENKNMHRLLLWNVLLLILFFLSLGVSLFNMRGYIDQKILKSSQEERKWLAKEFTDSYAFNTNEKIVRMNHEIDSMRLLISDNVMAIDSLNKKISTLFIANDTRKKKSRALK